MKGIVSSVLYVQITYYWVLLIFFGSDIPNPFIYTIPSLFFSLILFLLVARNRKFKKSSYLLLLFILFSLFTVAYNYEFTIILSTFMFTIPFIVVNEINFSLSRKFLYSIFFITIGVGILSFHLGINQFGYLPGHSLLMGSSPWWRIGLFPNSTPTNTGFFGILFFSVGCYYYLEKNKKNNKLNLLVIILSTYLTVLSGSRTAILILTGVFFIYYFKHKKILIQHMMPYFIIAIPIVILASESIFYLSGNELGEEYLLRGQSFDSEQAVSSYSRFILWDNLINIYKQSPLFGVGDFNLYDYYPYAEASSESKWLSLLASNGVAILLLLYYVLKKYYLAVKTNQYNQSSLLLMLIVAMFYYGSMYTPYNVIFLLNIYLISKFVKKNKRT